MLIVLSLPGIVVVAVDINWSTIWLLDEHLDSDLPKYQVFNPSLVEMVYAINEFQADHDNAPIIVAPGEQRLHFFFPEMQIIDQTMTTLNEFEAVGATHFIYGTQARWAYERANIDPTDNQLLASLGRRDRFIETKHHSGGTFTYELYYYYDRGRMKKPKSNKYPILYNDQDILFGDQLRLRAEGISPFQFFEGEDILLTSSWQAIQPISTDYLFVYELFDQDSSQIGYQWVLHIAPQKHGYYSPTLWDVGEHVGDEQFVHISETSKIQDGKNYVIRIRVLDPIKNRYLPVYMDGKPAGDFFTLAGTYKVGA